MFIFLWPLFLCGSDSLLEQCWDCLFKKGSGPPLTPLFSPHPNCEVDFSKNSISSHDINYISKSLAWSRRNDYRSVATIVFIDFVMDRRLSCELFVTPTLENIFQVSLEWKTRENISFVAFLEFLPYSAALYFCLRNFCVRLFLM